MNVEHGAAPALAIGLVVLVAAAVLVVLARRAGWSDPAVRRAVGTGGTVSAVLLLAQTAVVWCVAAGPVSNGLAAADGPVLRWFVAHRDPYATGFGVVLAVLGGPVSMTVLAAAAVLVLVYRGRREQAVLVAVAAATGGLLVRGFKAVYRRDRPPRIDQVLHYHDHSLPSGHALGSTVVLGLVAAVAYPALRAGAARLLLVAGALVAAVLVGVSRIYLAAHWLTDVLTGWLLGGAWLAAAVTALALLPARDPSDREPLPTR